MNTRSHSRRIAPLALGLFVFFLSLFSLHGLTFATNPDDSDTPTRPVTQTQTSESPTDDIESLINLRSLLQEHTALAHITLVNRYDKLADYTAAKEALDLNARNLSEIVRERFGEDSRDQFVMRWNHHNNLYIAYADALKANNEEKQQQVSDRLDQWAEDMAAFLTQGEKSDSEDEIANHLKQHGKLTTSVISSHAMGDHQEEYMTAHEAQQQAGMMAEMLSPFLLEE